jgi:hypothetical protein
MRESTQTSWRYRFNYLTRTKLALQTLARGTELSAYQRRLVATALDATDQLTEELLRQCLAECQPVPANPTG